MTLGQALKITGNGCPGRIRYRGAAIGLHPCIDTGFTCRQLQETVVSLQAIGLQDDTVSDDAVIHAASVEFYNALGALVTCGISGAEGVVSLIACAQHVDVVAGDVFHGICLVDGLLHASDDAVRHVGFEVKGVACGGTGFNGNPVTDGHVRFVVTFT